MKRKMGLKGGGDLAVRLGAAIKDERKRQSLSQEWVAENSNVSRKSISDYEAEITVPLLSTLERIAFALRVPTWQLMKAASPLAEDRS